MTDDTSQPWTTNGFEQFFDYVSSFIHLNINLGSEVACRRYHDEWMRKYRSAMEKWTEYDVAVWSIRCRQSLKLCFSATYFALSAEEAREAKALASAYYLAYYSILHAMWAVLFLHPEQSVESLTTLTHSKMANVFHSSFSHGKGNILRYNAKEMAEDLRFLREYYSYRMPLNSPFHKAEVLSQVHIHLGGFVKQSIQLANLHSHLVRKTAERLELQGASVPDAQRDAFKNDFFRINGKEHLARELRLLDPADLQAQEEYLANGCDLVPLSIAYDHMFDDYMTYMDDDRPKYEIIQKTRRLVYGALF
ncbi:hypothetical protein X994_314 [Burkholderia pseudomallei]|uniref:hypothetical protein n=1 Tax=Burkholderia pseudomallei TaxID=28450 RepID=UPI00052ACE0D|nr:hypothetical protein [Burkholderia pseudomallei]AIV79242.1 hypothetical protein X994_314 [Burkholderia pseudomallei]